MTQKHNLLKLLSDRQYHSVGEIIGLFIAQYGTRIKELRDEDIDILNIRYKDIPKSGQNEICRKRLNPPKSNDTFFKLITPNNLINFENLTLKPTKKTKQMRLL